MTAVEGLREVGTLHFVGGRFPDHRSELLDDRLNARPRDVGAGQR
jgi:hypothetical protein